MHQPIPSPIIPPTSILWLDEHLLVFNKPAGLTTLPDGYDPQAPHVRSLLEPHYGRLWVVHRLDRQTSGILVLARHAAAHRCLNDQFAARTVQKTYHALVAGAPPQDAYRLDQPLRTNAGRRHRTVIDPMHGKPAVTEIEVLAHFDGYSLIAATPHTGRTHQIRVHLAALGYPLLADSLYGSGRGLYLSDLKPGFEGPPERECAILGRLGLHAYSLCIRHPTTDKHLQIEAPYPKDFKGALRQLTRYRT